MTRASVKLRSKGPMLMNVPCDGGMYKNAQGVYMPAEWIKAALRGAHEPTRKCSRDTFLTSVFVKPLEIPLGKDDCDEVHRSPVKIGHITVIRERPMFYWWEVTFDLEFEPTVIEAKSLKALLEKAGTRGVGDWRPKFGRFTVTDFKVA